MKDFLYDKDYQKFTLNNNISQFSKDEVTVVIPVLNEEESIGQVLKKFKKEGYNNILVIDGYSTDNTVQIASINGANIIYQHGIGKTGAIKTAIEHIKTTYFLIMAGDCT